MKALTTLAHAATLKGFLIGTSAPAEIVSLAQQLMDAVMAEPPKGEVIASPAPAFEVSGCDEVGHVTRQEYCWKPEEKEMLLRLKAEGRDWAQIANSLAKTVSQCRAMFHSERKRLEGRAIGKEPQKAGGERWNPKLTPDMLPTILKDLETLNFRECGARHGVTSHAIIAFLKRNEVDHGQFKKKPGQGVTDWKYSRLEQRVPLPETAQASAKEEVAATEAGEMGEHSLSSTRGPILKTAPIVEPLPAAVRSSARGHNPENVWEDWQLQKLREMKEAGAIASDIARAVNKTTTQVHNKWTWLSRSLKAQPVATDLDADGWPLPTKPEKGMVLDARPNARQEAVEALLAAMPEGHDSPNSKLKRDDIPRILKMLETISMAAVSERLGLSNGASIDKFLKGYGIDYRTLPAAPTSQNIADRQPAKPLMKFRRVETVQKRKGRWGDFDYATEEVVAVPEGTYKDQATGATVTKYPPGYAYGAGPQKNVYVKGGS